MPSMQEGIAHSRLNSWAAMGLFAIALFLFSTLSWSQEHDMGNMPGVDMNAPTACENPAQAAKHLADKQERELNHRLVGSVVIVAGIFIFVEGCLVTGWSLVRCVWLMAFVGFWVCVLLFSERG